MSEEMEDEGQEEMED